MCLYLIRASQTKKCSDICLLYMKFLHMYPVSDRGSGKVFMQYPVHAFPSQTDNNDQLQRRE